VELKGVQDVGLRRERGAGGRGAQTRQNPHTRAHAHKVSHPQLLTPKRGQGVQLERDGGGHSTSQHTTALHTTALPACLTRSERT
jgi:hypothetical protein